MTRAGMRETRTGDGRSGTEGMQPRGKNRDIGSEGTETETDTGQRGMIEKRENGTERESDTRKKWRIRGTIKRDVRGMKTGGTWI